MAEHKYLNIDGIRYLTKKYDLRYAKASHSHKKSDITDFPTSMPASDVYAWAKASTKPTYTAAEVGLDKVDNTSDEDKPISRAVQAALDGKSDTHNHPYMPLAGGQFTGKVSFSSSTALPENTSMQYLLGIDAFTSGGTMKWTSKANLLSGYALIGSSNDASTVNSIYGAKAYADSKIAALVDSAPDTLNTLNELAVAINTNKDAVTAINSSITNKVDKTTKVNGKALSSNVTITTEDIASKLSAGGTLGQDIQHLSDDKVDKVSGKGLSTNDFTTAYKNKLDGIASGAEVNVQSDWSVTDTSSDAYIKNKPTIPTNTWRGIQNNLTSTSTTESLSAYQGKLLNEKFDNYLPLTGGTITAGNTLILGATSNANSSKLKWGTVNSKTPYFSYASDQTDGTFVWSITGTTYQTGLAIGGGSGNLLWKGVKVATVNDIPSGVAVDTSLSSTSSNAVANKAVSAAIDILTEDVENLKQADNLYLPKAGGTITGTVTQTAGDMITQYCAVKSAGHETGSYSKIATLSSTGYIRYRTPAEMKTDLGVGQIKIGSTYYTATLSGTTLALTSI